MSTAEIRKHWDRVARLGCLMTGAPNPTLHHIHGGSCKEVGLHRAMGRKSSDWLVIPLAAEYHTGQYGIDSAMGVAKWEALFGRQVDLMDTVCEKLDVNLWTKAGVDRNPFHSLYRQDHPKRGSS